MARSTNLNFYEPTFDIDPDIEAILSEWDWPDHTSAFIGGTEECWSPELGYDDCND